MFAGPRPKLRLITHLNWAMVPLVAVVVSSQLMLTIKLGHLIFSPCRGTDDHQLFVWQQPSEVPCVGS